jgi:hypothetical protein
VTFNLETKVEGVGNKLKLVPFTLVPATATVKAHSDYPVKIIFQPDHLSNYYFNIMLLDIPNQVRPKNIYARGWCYSRQLFAREHEPFEWKPFEKLKRKYEDPLKLICAQSAVPQAPKQRIVLEFAREEDINFNDTPYEKEKNKFRRIVVGSCRLLDNKLEKNGTYEIAPGPGKDAQYFECDQPKGALGTGQELVLKFTFNHPKVDPLLKDIAALKGIGQWVESLWELKLIGGFVEAGQSETLPVEIVLRAYVEQI